MKSLIIGAALSVLVLGIWSCSTEEKTPDTLFTKLSERRTGIDFANNLKYDKEFNIYTYRNFYNGGGVAIGDINNDGLVDVYFTANMDKNRLYVNKGDFKFEDITDKAGVAGTRAWSTGVAMADVNGDGWLDIYVCNSGDVKGDDRENELFINNGDGTFTENAQEYGLADKGYSTHAAFFDYDKDGDLDMYLLNNSYRAIGSFDLRKNERNKRDPEGGHKFFRNDDGHFTDVSAQVGIYGSIIGFGLGVTVGDVNQDGWQDIYVSNDFFERDYLYINQQNGTFSEELESRLGSISAASMGADMADVNNDGTPEIFVTEMLPEPNERLKTATTFDNWNRYRQSVDNGYFHQFTRNMLQLNNGDGSFAEVGRLAGVEATDWSWGALIFDMDNDGKKDIFVANGIYQDLTNQDFLNFIASEEVARSVITKQGVDYKKLIDAIPSQPVPNYAFHNQGNLKFTNKAREWGLDEPSFSNGSAYGDLDNDGDLDLIVNNVNMPVFIYRNESNQILSDNRWLAIELKGEGNNQFALGTKLRAFAKGVEMYQEQMPIRGFESSMDPRPHLGLGNVQTLDSLVVEWYDGKRTVLRDVPTNQVLKLSYSEAVAAPLATFKTSETLVFQEVTQNVSIDFKHQENLYVDFDRDRLIYQMLSTEGPKLAKADVNGDGREDFYIGGAKDQAGKLFVQLPDGQFKSTNENVLEQDKAAEDTDALFFDADGDGDADLYVASGGNEYPNTATALIDRLYVNDGRGNFTKSNQILPSYNFESTSCVQAADFDKDGDLDLFVGVRVRPFQYGVPCNGYILLNDGKGNYSDHTQKLAPGLLEIGMITDAITTDYDKDGDADIIIVGEYMPITLFRNDNGLFKNVTETAGLSKSNGWWNCLKPGDFDKDGDLDFVVANHGWNSRFRASEEKPVCLYINDFDQNGSVEQILCTFNGDKSYPMALRHDLISQLPGLKKKYLKYDSYKNQTIQEIFTPDQLKNAIKLDAFTFSTSILINKGDGTFELKALPMEAQLAPMFGLLVEDVDQDGNLDIIMGGNFYAVKPEAGRYDASNGLWLKGDGKNGFQAISYQKSGLHLKGEVRDLLSIQRGKEKWVLVSRNDDALQIFSRQ